MRGTRVSHRCGKSPRREKGAGRVGTPASVGCCRVCGASDTARAGCGHHTCGATSPRSSCKAQRQRRVGTPANFIGTFVGNNRTAVVSAPLCWGLFTRLVLGREQGERECRVQLRQQCSMSTPPIVLWDGVFPLEERDALIFLCRSFKKGLLHELNCFLLLLNLNLKFMGRNFSRDLYTLRSLIDF